MISSGVRIFIVCALTAASAPALAQTPPQKQTTQKQTTKPTASQQLRYANGGDTQRNHVFDGTKAPAKPVSANPASKPSPVGQPVASTRTTPGYKPARPSLHINPVPAPVTRTSTAPAAKPTTTATVAKPTTTATVVRSTTTATTPSKKP